MILARLSLLLPLALLGCAGGDKDAASGDGHVDTGPLAPADADADGFDAGADCDDADPAINPGVAEICDGLDNDCDGSADEDVTDTFYADDDADGFGDDGAQAQACEAPQGYAAVGGDCDDGEAASYPGGTEVCDEADNDCDGDTDEDVGEVYYVDADGDGFGLQSGSIGGCYLPPGHARQAGDCDDGAAAISPLAVEVCDGADNDCDGYKDEDSALDALDWYIDYDGDSYGSAAYTQVSCDQPSGYVADADDCDDTDDDTLPGGTEVCDGADNDCDGVIDEGAADAPLWYGDADGDGYAGTRFTLDSCDQPTNYYASADDCDDLDPGSYPGGDELCDGADNDCDGSADEGTTDSETFYADDDGDGYGDPGSWVEACSPPAGYTGDDESLGWDCDDSDAGINPAEDEICDEADNDCDGDADEAGADGELTWYADDDGDGYGDAEVTADGCAAPDGYTADDTDCDDADATVHETCSGFPTFSGVTGTAWEPLTHPSGEPTYSLITYQSSDIPYIYNMYYYTGQYYNTSTNVWTYLAASAPYSNPWTSMAPWDGDLWMIRNSSVYSYDPPTDTWTTEATISGGDDHNMTESDEDGVIYGHTSDGHIVEYDATTGAVSYHSTGLGGEFETRLAYDPIGRAIFFGAYSSSSLYRFDLATHAITTMKSHPESQLNDIFCGDRSGHIYAAGNTSGTTMYQYTIATNTWKAIPSLPSDHGNNGSCTVSADGWLYVGTGSNYTFYRLKLY